VNQTLVFWWKDAIDFLYSNINDKDKLPDIIFLCMWWMVGSFK
jgi:hypothetical protein